MQPTLAVTAPVPGILHINGRFLGELSADAPLLFPICAFGPLYLEYHPLESGHMSMARKLVFSGGRPLTESLETDGLFAVLWPGNITEIELSPPEDGVETIETLSFGDLTGRLVHGPHSRLELGPLHCAVPDDLHPPELRRLNGCIALHGRTSDGQYLLTAAEDLTRQTGFLRAGSIEFDSPNTVRALTGRGDVAGHGTLERWRLDEFGPVFLSSEPVWMEGTPRLPSTPEQTALAAAEAALLGLFDEASEHLSPSLRSGSALDAIAELGSLCLPMKYAPPDGQSAIALLRMESANSAVVHPLYYQAEHRSGRWMLTSLETE